MAKKTPPTLPLIPEDRLEPLRGEVERLGEEHSYAFLGLSHQPYYRPLVYYVTFSHLLKPMRAKLGGIDDKAAIANAYFWYRVVAEWATRIDPEFNPVEGEMDGVEGSPGHFFTDDEFVALWDAAAEYVTRHRRSEGASKAAATRKRRPAGAKAPETGKQKSTGRKAVGRKTKRGKQ